jgi:hypothetical protein
MPQTPTRRIVVAIEAVMTSIRVNPRFRLQYFIGPLYGALIAVDAATCPPILAWPLPPFQVTVMSTSLIFEFPPIWPTVSVMDPLGRPETLVVVVPLVNPEYPADSQAAI